MKLRKEEAREAIEKVISDYSDVFVTEDDELQNRLPVLSSWVLLTAHDDASDPEVLSTFRMCARYQAAHTTVGMLTLHCDDLRRPVWTDG